jgi:glyoxylase-like metal-dependent hydrolase (beta-lactamase superfamily II)
VRVHTSRLLQTNCTILDCGWIVDSPYFPDEIDEVARLAPHHRIAATHAHYDHLLMSYTRAPLHVHPATRHAIETGNPARELADFDAVNYVARPPLELQLADARDLHHIPAPGHTADAHALWFADERVLCCGDYLSDVEIPLLSETGDRAAYRATLERLEPYVRDALAIVPGHGSPCERDGALRRLQEDVTYLDTRRIPPGRDTSRQREIHANNVRDHP